MGQNPSKHSDYMQVLKTSFKSSGVEISHSSFKELFSAIKKYCYCHLWGRTESDKTEATNFRALARQEEGGQFLLMDSVATSAGVDYTTLLLPRMKNKVRS